MRSITENELGLVSGGENVCMALQVETKVSNAFAAGMVGADVAPYARSWGCAGGGFFGLGGAIMGSATTLGAIYGAVIGFACGALLMTYVVNQQHLAGANYVEVIKNLNN